MSADDPAADDRAADNRAADNRAADTSTPSASRSDETGGADDVEGGAGAQSDAEQSRAEQSRAEQSGTDPSGTAGEPSGASYWQRRKAHRAEKKARPRRKAPWWELPALVVLAILIAIVVKTFVIQPFYIPSESMEKTLHGCPGCRGDRILVNKPIYDLRDPHPGDIVVFDAPKGWDDEPTSTPPSNPILRGIRGFGQLIGFVPPDGQVLVKRVIATGGQTVKGDSDGHVMVSTQGTGGPYRTLREPYVFVDSPGGQRDFGPVTVPKGRLWVMGDHRNDSADSRYHCGTGGSDTSDDLNCNARSSTVPIDNVIGKAFVIAWPPSRWRTLGTPSTFESAQALVTPAVPTAVSLVALAPVFLVRRRRRTADR